MGCSEDPQEDIALLGGRACAVEIGAYCWMPNHVHLIAVPEAAHGVRRPSAIPKLLLRYGEARRVFVSRTI